MSELVQQRLEDKITNVAIYSHGVIGSIELGYMTKRKYELGFSEEEVSRIDPGAFSQTGSFQSFTCQTANAAEGKKSLAQLIANRIQRTVRAAERRDSYETIYGGMYERRVESGMRFHDILRESVGGAYFFPIGAKVELELFTQGK